MRMNTDSSSSTPDSRLEFAFIDWIARQNRSRAEVVLGIGDDAAILSAPGKEWVTTVDVLTAGVHFKPETSMELVGRKALAVNLSDLAAMAAVPCTAFVGIVLPKTMSRTQAEALYRGIFELANEWDVTIAGGDTNSWDGPLVISITLNGLVDPGKAVRRDGAQPGDAIFVTGALGGSFESGHHLTFTPRIREAQQLQQLVTVHAMMDLSDGLGSDLFHLIRQSRCGAIVDAASLPVHPDLPASLSPEERIQRALGDGEDFELLFCVSEADGQTLMERWSLDVPITKIGEITSGNDAMLKLNDRIVPFPRTGWSHSFG
jgi:thiamine-monophosphate kinase